MKKDVVLCILKWHGIKILFCVYVEIYAGDYDDHNH